MIKQLMMLGVVLGLSYGAFPISLGESLCFVDPQSTGGWGALDNTGLGWVDVWADGEDWAVVPIDGASEDDRLTPVVFYGSASSSMVSSIHIESESRFKARVAKADYFEYPSYTHQTDPDDIERFVESRKWLMVKIKRNNSKFSPKTFYVGVNGCSEFRKFVIVCDGSNGAPESGVGNNERIVLANVAEVCNGMGSGVYPFFERESAFHPDK